MRVFIFRRTHRRRRLGRTQTDGGSHTPLVSPLSPWTDIIPVSRYPRQYYHHSRVDNIVLPMLCTRTINVAPSFSFSLVGSLKRTFYFERTPPVLTTPDRRPSAARQLNEFNENIVVMNSTWKHV